MCELLKRSVIMSFMIFSILFLNYNCANADERVEWVTTNVILESGKCTIKGYFKNNTNLRATVNRIRFVLDAYNEDTGANIWSCAWVDTLTNCYIPAGSTKNWSFWRYDKSCPKYSNRNGNWNVTADYNYDLD